MKRWSESEHGHVSAPDIDAFLSDIEAVCAKHGMAISHQDQHGAFEIVNINQETIRWMMAANDARVS